MVRQVKTVRVDLGDITDKNVGQLKVLNRTLFPVQYQAKFYKSVVEDPNYVTQLAFYGGDALVGAVCCRLEKEKTKSSIYIMTLGVLAPYRDLGIGKKLLNYVLNDVVEKFKDQNVQDVYLHMQEGNEAIKFYSKFGFEEGEKVENYYTNIEPSSAIILRKKLN